MIIMSKSVRQIISKVRLVTALAVRVLDRLLRDNPFTYLAAQHRWARGWVVAELGSLNQPVDSP